jgi:protein-L-isoaspartate(D-aspartate) O-methyltransferase
MRKKVYFMFALIILLAVSAGCGGDSRSSGPDSGRDFITMRERMVETQIKGRGVKDQRVLSAMLKVERHRFIPQQYQSQAYADQPLPIGEGQTISQPYIVALMTELLELTGEEKVLEIGTGSGYQAAVLAELTREVYTIEIIEPLATSAKNLLLELGYRNIQVKAGDGYLGWPEKAPFDAIIVTCAPDHIPKPLLEQLKEKGRLVMPVGTYSQELKKIVKISGKIETTDIIPVIFVPMTGEGAKQKK